MSKTIFVFPGTRSATLAEVGGKGLSLMQGRQAGLSVPPGFFFSVSFFLPWLQHLQATNAWSEFLYPHPSDFEHARLGLKQHALLLFLTKQQEHDITAAILKYI